MGERAEDAVAGAEGTDELARLGAGLALRLMPRLSRWAAARLEADPLGHDLSLRQFGVLYALCGGPLAAGELARAMRVTPAVVTGIVDRLERRGFVRREADPTDRRRQSVVLTEAGREASREIGALLTAELAERLADAPVPELARLHDGLALLERALGEVECAPAIRRRPRAGVGTCPILSATDPPADPEPIAGAATDRQLEEPMEHATPDGGAPAALAAADEPVSVDLQGHEARERAFQTFAELRERGPVTRIALEGIVPSEEAREGSPFVRELFFVTHYEEGVAALLDDRFSVDPRSAMTAEERVRYDETPREFRPLSRSLLTVDPPDHTRLRRLVQPSFTGRTMDALRPRIRDLANDLLDAAERQAIARGEDEPDRTMELIDQFAYPLPVAIISDLLGIPEEDRERTGEWTEKLVTGRFQQGDEAAREGLRGFTDYLRELFARRRRQPTDDLISSLVQAEEDGDKLDEDELLSMVFILYIAGHITTVNLIGNGVYALLTHPEELAKLKADPGLAKGVVEETLRFYGPAEGIIPRVATEPVAIGGRTIPEGERIMVSLASADRDPARFAAPDRFEITRPDANRHIAFGKGIHACLGAPLARVEGQEVFALLFARYPNLRLAVPAAALRWRPGFLRGLEALPVAF